MTHDTQDLLSRFLDEGFQDEAAVRELAAMPDDRPEGIAAARVDLETELLLQTLLVREEDLRHSQDRLRAKAVLREQNWQWRSASRRRARLGTWAAAAVLVVVAAAVTYRWLAPPLPYPDVSAQGDLTVCTGVVGRHGERLALARGARVVAGSGGARLGLGGYCDLALASGTEIVVGGRPQQEVVRIVVGRLTSRVTPGRGSYRVRTPTGDLEVKGTEFVTTVEYREGSGSKPKAAVVSVQVLAGAVAFAFGEEKGILAVGASQVFAMGPGEPDALPEGMKGFAGILRGRVADKGDGWFTLAVGMIEQTWPSSEAIAADTAIGHVLRLRVLPQQRAILERLARAKVDGEVVVDVVQRERSLMHVAEGPMPVPDLPTLLAKEAGERAAREARQRRERREGDTRRGDEARRLREEEARRKRQLDKR